MSSKGKRPAAAGGRSAARAPGAAGTSESSLTADRRAQLGILVVVILFVIAVVIASDFIFGALTGSTNSGAGPTATPTGASTQIGVVVPGQGGHWTNVSANQLADMLTHKDFTLVNVKTPYIGEIDGTDLYIPYDQLAARASTLPATKGDRILVYCRSGAESAQAAQTLLNLGYTNVWNLDGGMNAWQASGRRLVTKSR